MTVWVVWAALVLVAFAWLETRAIRRNRPTLSLTVWWISQRWPPFPFVVGLVVGGLAVHFWWHWCP